MFASIIRNAFLLAAFAIVCTGAIALVKVMTEPAIALQQQQALLNTVNQLIPDDLYDNDIINSCFIVNDPLLGNNREQQVFIAKKEKQPVALMLESSTFSGYSGEIKLVIAIYESGKIAGVRVLSHSETPGLGDKIQTNKSDWILSFDGSNYSYTNDKQWEVKKYGGEFDAFTGATITPRAIVLAVKNALIYFQYNKEMLFTHRANCGDKL